jgi:NADH:ubiquinone oxidoreductase subunit B-like Fe-S oxidoreductase
VRVSSEVFSTDFAMSIEGVLQEGFVTTQLDKLINWTRTGSLVADDLRARLLRR